MNFSLMHVESSSPSTTTMQWMDLLHVPFLKLMKGLKKKSVSAVFLELTQFTRLSLWRMLDTWTEGWLSFFPNSSFTNVRVCQKSAQMQVWGVSTCASVWCHHKAVQSQFGWSCNEHQSSGLLNTGKMRFGDSNMEQRDRTLEPLHQFQQ